MRLVRDFDFLQVRASSAEPAEGAEQAIVGSDDELVTVLSPTCCLIVIFEVSFEPDRDWLLEPLQTSTIVARDLRRS